MFLKIFFLGAMYFILGSIITIAMVNVVSSVPTNKEIAILILFWPIPATIILLTVVIGCCVLFVEKFLNKGNRK